MSAGRADVDRINHGEPDPHVPDVTTHDAGQPLRTQVASGIRWGIIISIATQVGRIAFTVALMRLLGPRNFGIVGQATVIITVAQIFVHFGLATNIVQRARLEQGEVGSAFWLNVTLGLVLAILMVLSAPLLSMLFRTEELTATLRVLSISVVLKAMTLVPTALLTRNMRFRSIATVEITSIFVSGMLGIGAAVTGASYWALVIQAVSLEAIYLLLILYLNGLPELTWSAAKARSLWSFSSRILAADLVNYMSGNFDKFLVARFLGATALGLYSLGFRVLQLTGAVVGQVGRVILPTFSRLQDDRERLARAFIAVTETVSLAVFPAMTLTILIAPIGVPAVVGEAWTDAVVPLQLVAAMTIPFMLVSLMGPLTVATGRADCEFYFAIVVMVAMLVMIPIGLQWGITGVVALYLIMISVLYPIRLAIIQRLVPVSARGYVRALAPAATCSIALAFAYLLTEFLLQSAMSGLVLAAAASVTGVATYAVVLRTAWPHDFRRQLEFTRLVMQGDRP